MKEIEKLRVLLPHWIEHNEEHAAEFRQWAERAEEAGADMAAPPPTKWRLLTARFRLLWRN